MKRPTFALLCTLLFSCLAAAQSAAGEWRGEIEIPGTPMAIVVRLQAKADTWSGNIDIPVQGAAALPLSDVHVEGRKVRFTIPDTPGEPTFRGELDESAATLRGAFTQGGAELKFSLRRADAAAAEDRARFAGMGAWLDETRTMFDVPGCAVAVIKGGEVVAMFASGQRDSEGKLPVSADTLFAIGSSTKAFTTCLLAMLVEEGRLAWDEPVRRWLPEFTLADAVIGERLTPRDLVTHRSGMPRHDLVWYGADFDRRELVGRLRYLPLNHDLRTDFQYNNLMFLTAGHLAERITGHTWEELVRDRLLQPLGMTRSNLAVAAMQRDGDHALPYARKDGKVLRVSFRDISAIGPAGSINSSVREMANWVALHLQKGEFAGKRLLSAALVEDLHTVRMAFGGMNAGDDDVVGVGYALGWFVDVYRGHRRVHHGGNIDGFSALVSMLPDANLGFVVLTNLDATGLPELVAQHLADQALGLPEHDTRRQQREQMGQAEVGKQRAKQAEVALRRSERGPSRPPPSSPATTRIQGMAPCTSPRQRVGCARICMVFRRCWNMPTMTCSSPWLPTIRSRSTR